MTERIKFYKMHGLGNDYVYIDLISQISSFKEITKLVKQISDRHCGIGSDGVVVLLPSSEANFQMRMFNSDGSGAEMCGNAARCVAALAHRLRLADKNMTISTTSGIIGASVNGDNVKVKMFSQPLVKPEIDSIDTIEQPFEYRYVAVGNPHAVIKLGRGKVDNFPVKSVGQQIENNIHVFPQRTNVEFYEEVSPAVLKMRVWERGAGETQACGTGACAVAGAYRKEAEKEFNEITVQMLGGDLKLSWENSDFYMEGPASFVFSGEIDLDNLRPKTPAKSSDSLKNHTI